MSAILAYVTICLMKNATALAIIPARGGSKRIPHKNIKLFLGKPIISYSIQAALQSGCFNEVMVSTDDQEITRIAKKFGAVVPFLRSQKASNDEATTADVIDEVLHQYRRRGRQFEFFCTLYPTAPFVTPEKLRSAFEILKKTDVDSVMPVVKYSSPIQRALIIKNGKLRRLHPEYAKTRSQDLPPTYHDPGQFYFMRTKAFVNRHLTNNTIPFEIPELEAQDIDTPQDWIIAEYKYRFPKGNL